MAQAELKEAVTENDVTLSRQQYLTFMLGGETFAIGILAIKEIIEYGQLTEVPRMPDFIRGVINLRGAVVPVIDLKARFSNRLTEVARRTCIVIIEVQSGDDETQDIGILVDAVNEVLEIPQPDIEPPPSFGAAIESRFINGMGKVNDKFVIILDIAHILMIDEISQLAADHTESVSPLANNEGSDESSD